MDVERVPFTGLDGKVHMVPAAEVDQFVDGRTGLPLTNEAYDESKRRLRAAEAADAAREASDG